MSYSTILVETREPVGLVTLNRPKALNSLSSELMGELRQALDAFEADDGVGAVVITGSERAFAAGADIKEMAGYSYPGTFLDDFIASWGHVAARKKPIIAAVAGFALGGGCELALMCDLIIAADTAQFGQPEIRLGIIPGAGGTQRLIRAIGKSKAMDLILTGRTMGAEEAERSGLVARVVPAAELVETAVRVAGEIARHSPIATRLAKEAVNRAYESSLAEGLLYERRAFQALFATVDQKEGMGAFLEKRPPKFEGR
ncbi:MAG: enoyl-CoA hydratase [Ancalomicrobiaceae bacterium]|nr:enoyl-CoA hydratase [Ancalomicrobiaceae bacterium]